jgi:predicted Zn-dependent protease
VKRSFTLLLISFFISTGILLPQEKAEIQKANPVGKTRSSVEDNSDKQNSTSSLEVSYDYSNIFDVEELNAPYDLAEKNKAHIRYTAYSPNYFRIEESSNSLWDGKHWLELDYPLEVYVKKSFSKYFKSKFLKYIDYAFTIWKSADNRIEFRYVDSDSDADIIISFENNLMDKYDENFLGLTDYVLTNGKRIIHSSVEIGMLKFDSEVVTDGEVKATIIHEIGHALGMGHSDNEIDLMYPFISPGSNDTMSFIELSRGDIKAVQSLINLGFRKKYSNR